MSHHHNRPRTIQRIRALRICKTENHYSLTDYLPSKFQCWGGRLPGLACSRAAVFLLRSTTGSIESRLMPAEKQSQKIPTFAPIQLNKKALFARSFKQTLSTERHTPPATIYSVERPIVRPERPIVRPVANQKLVGVSNHKRRPVPTRRPDPFPI